MSQHVVSFSEAQVGDWAYTYEGDAVSDMFLGWIADLDYFDDRDDEIKLKRKLWQLIEVDEIALPNPYPPDDEPLKGTGAH